MIIIKTTFPNNLTTFLSLYNFASVTHPWFAFCYLTFFLTLSFVAQCINSATQDNLLTDQEE